MHCRERTIVPAVIPYERQLEHDGRKYTVSIPDLQVLQCSTCGAIALDDAADQRISDALRAEVGLLLPQEIRAQREALDLTQKEMAEALKLSESTLSRWETGAQIQQRSMDQILRAFFALEPLRAYLGVVAAQGTTPGPIDDPAPRPRLRRIRFAEDL